MKLLWCWRCRETMPMLEPAEAALLYAARVGGMRVVEEEARRRGRVLLPMTLTGIERVQQPILEMYRLLTGFVETNPAAVWHHLEELYGPPCPQCRKPLRTPEARFCAACGFGQQGIHARLAPLLQRYPALFNSVQEDR